MSFFLVRGSPYLALSVTKPTPFLISTIHDIIYFSSNDSLTKFTIRFNNNQAWILYASIKIKLSHSRTEITSEEAFFGTIRIALLPDSDSKHEAVLDRYRFCYPVSGDAILREPFCVEYEWEKKGWCDLLMLAHPLHIQLLSKNDCNNVTVLNDFKYKRVILLVLYCWRFMAFENRSCSYYLVLYKGVKEKHHEEIVTALFKDVEKVKVKKFLKEDIEPWLDGPFKGNGFLHDQKSGGIVTKQGSTYSNAENGFGICNDHHFILGYFVYAMAVLVCRVDILSHYL
ncbi:unnamed protein product [Trifolium pratense]|uniref:Uncharacterized protein n=1 Tax=Trifolium pratense TaxID=57577 RepID=A0ACB0L956_TRIPR|nr:unnamed protein product [Trifolium pratense]